VGWGLVHACSLCLFMPVHARSCSVMTFFTLHSHLSCLLFAPPLCSFLSTQSCPLALSSGVNWPVLVHAHSQFSAVVCAHLGCLPSFVPIHGLGGWSALVHAHFHSCGLPALKVCACSQFLGLICSHPCSSVCLSTCPSTLPLAGLVVRVCWPFWLCVVTNAYLLYKHS